MEKTVYNSGKSLEEYQEGSAFFGSEPGLFDTVNVKYPKIKELYEEMVSLDWTVTEFDFETCKLDFLDGDPAITEKMLKTVVYQWEQDSVASRAIAPVLAPFITDSYLWALYQRISDNECVHSMTYSEIVRQSFDNPRVVLSDILTMKETVQRMDATMKVFNETMKLSHLYALGMVKESQGLYNSLYKFVATLLIMERVQFMASFAVTFTICRAGMFQAIGEAVKRICQDEFEVHVQTGKEVIKIIHQEDWGKIAREQTKDEIKSIFREVIESEFRFIDEYLYSDGKALVGTSPELLKKWVMHCSKDVSNFLDIDPEMGAFPDKNPLPYMDEWVNPNMQQPAPMEKDHAKYKTNLVKRDVINDDFGEFL